MWGVWDIAHNTSLEIAADMGAPIATLVALGCVAIFVTLIYGGEAPQSRPHGTDKRARGGVARHLAFAGRLFIADPRPWNRSNGPDRDRIGAVVFEPIPLPGGRAGRGKGRRSRRSSNCRRFNMIIDVMAGAEVLW
jgi:hypothetical protein